MANKQYDPTGGAAYPEPAPYGEHGMTLYDHYAGLAMMGIQSKSCDKSQPWTPGEVAVDAFDQAEAMIAEKAKRESERWVSKSPTS